MIERLLSRLARAGRERPRLVATLCVLPALASLHALRVPLDFSFSGVMDRSHPEVARYFAASERYGLGGLLPLLVEGPEASLDEAVLALRLALDGMDEVRFVTTGPPRDWLMTRSPWLAPRDVFDAWVALAEGPADLAASRALRAELDALEERRAPRPPPGTRLVLVTMSRDTFELALDADDFPRIRRAAGEALAPFGASARFAGMPAIVTQEQEATIERMRFLGPASLVLVLTVLLLIERRPLVLASLALPMLLSVGCTLGIIGLFASRFTIMEAVFGVIVFGLGIDFAIHLLLRFEEERTGGRDFTQSLERAIAGTGRGIVAAAATSGGAFLVLAAAPDPVFYRLGLAGGLGLLLCLVLLLALLPAEWSWIESRRGAGAHSDRVPGRAMFARIASASADRAWLVLGATALAVAGAAAALPALRYETNLERVFSRDIDAVETAREIHALFGVDPAPWISAVDELDTARSLTDRFEASPMFARAESLGFVFPADLSERQETLDRLADGLARRVRERELAAMDLPGRAGEEAHEALEPLSLLLSAHALGPPRRDALPEALAERFVGPGDELLVYAFVEDPVLDSAVAARERRAAQAIHPQATSMNAIYEALIGTDRPWMPPIVAAVALLIACVLALDLRSGRLVVLALAPVTTATVATLGLLAAFGFSFNTVTLVGVPLLLGIGVDDGIHLVHRMLEEPRASLGRIVGSVARGIGMTTLTTCASVALLLFTRHPGIQSVATLLLVGLPLCLLASVTVLPALAVAMRVGDLARRRAGTAAAG